MGLALSMEDVVLRGEFEGIHRQGMVQCGRIMVDWIYNSMPPAPGQIYPPKSLEPVSIY
jgi:hypothetical protein